MNVLHIIPAVKDYFIDIRSEAMALVEHEREMGIDTEAYTLQSGSVREDEKTDSARRAPSMKYRGIFSEAQVIAQMNSSDIVHLHAPFIGLAGDIIKWKKSCDIPLVISFHRGVAIGDVFSFLLYFYNGFFLKRIFDLADAIIVRSEDAYNKNSGLFSRKNDDKLILLKNIEDEVSRQNIHLTLDDNKLKLTKEDVEAMAYISVYNHLLNI